MTKDKEKSLSKYLSSIEDRLSSLTNTIPAKHAKRSSAGGLRQFLEREKASAKAALAKAKGL